MWSDTTRVYDDVVLMGYWTSEMTASQIAGLIIHEMSHIAWDTEDGGEAEWWQTHCIQPNESYLALTARLGAASYPGRAPSNSEPATAVIAVAVTHQRRRVAA